MLIFRNPGLIDMDAALTMGVSVKEGEGPIGYFGTGLKFAVATVLRLGGSVVLWRGTDRHEFTGEATTIRGQEFTMVCLDGQRLGFTTQLGRNWEPWMAYREFASNCRDEGGEVIKASASAVICDTHKVGHTTFCVTGLDGVWPERGTILLESEPLAENDFMEVHPGASQFVFYRGVRIATAPRPLLFSYNLKGNLELTEDRTAKTWFYVELALEKGLAALEDEQLIRQTLTGGEMTMEHHLDATRWGNPSEAFRKVARELTLGREHVPNVNPAAVSMARASAVQDMTPGDSMELSAVQLQMLQRAKWLLVRGGYPVEDFPLICLETLGSGIHGLAKDGKIFLAAAAFDKGTRELAATIFEEFAHLSSGHSDETRQFQNWLIDRVLLQIEQQEGEPF